MKTYIHPESEKYSLLVARDTMDGIGAGNTSGGGDDNETRGLEQGGSKDYEDGNNEFAAPSSKSAHAWEELDK